MTLQINLQKRILCMFLICLILMFSVCDELFQAKAIVAEATVGTGAVAVCAAFLIAAGVVFVSTGDMDRACQHFLSNCVSAKEFCQGVYENVHDGMAVITPQLKQGVSDFYIDLCSYFGDSVTSLTVVDNALPIKIDSSSSEIDLVSQCCTGFIGHFDTTSYYDKKYLKISDYYNISDVESLLTSQGVLNLTSGLPYDEVINWLFNWEVELDGDNTGLDVYTCSPLCYFSSQSSITNIDGIDYYPCKLKMGFISHKLQRDRYDYEYFSSSVSPCESVYYVYVPVSLITDNTNTILSVISDIPVSHDSLYDGADVYTKVDEILGNDGATVDLNIADVETVLQGDVNAEVGVTQTDVLPTSVTDGLDTTGTVDPPVIDPNVGALDRIASSIANFFDSPSDFKLNFDAFKGQILIDRFPFCIPFDFVNSIKTFASASSDYQLAIDIDTSYLEIHHVVDLTPFSLPIAFFRYASSIWFAIFLMFKTRDLIKW